MKVLEIGPSPTRSKGGMATVIEGIKKDIDFCEKYSIDFHESYIDGPFLTRLLFSIYSFIRFTFIFKAYDVFHIHIASYGSTFRKGYYIRFLKRHGKKVILHVHGAEYLKFYAALSIPRKVNVQEIWNKCDRIVVLSHEWQRRFAELFDVKEIVVINNGIETQALKSGRCDLKSHNNGFLFLGRLEERKGAYDIISAVALIKKDYPAIIVYMAGDGDNNQFRTLIMDKKLDNNIKVIGWADFNKKVELFRSVDTLLLPSYHEGLPMAVLEGMAAGKVVITTDVGGLPEVVSDGINGIVIHPGDISALCNAMVKVMMDSNFVTECSANNLEKIEMKFNIKKMHSMLGSLFDQVSS